MMLSRPPYWPPLDPLRVIAARFTRRLRRKPWAVSTMRGMYSDARMVLLRQGLDLYTIPAVEDHRAELLRSTEPPAQAPFARPHTIARLLSPSSPLPLMPRLLLATMWGSMARPSDWIGSEGRRPVRAEEVTCIPPHHVQVLYRRTRPDPAGLGRRTQFVLPQQYWTELRRRVQRIDPHDSVFLPADLRPVMRALHSLSLCARSLRRGSVRAALLAGVSVRRVQLVTGHKQQATVLRYACLLAPHMARDASSASAAVWASAPLPEARPRSPTRRRPHSAPPSRRRVSWA